MDVKKTKGVFFKELSLLKIVFWTAVLSCLIILGDDKAVYYTLKELLGIKLLIIFAASAIFVLVTSLFKYHFFNLLKLPCGNVLDELLFIGLFSSGLVFAGESYLGYLLYYKEIILTVVSVLCTLLLLIRMIYCGIRKKESKAKDNSLVDLCDFLSDGFKWENTGKPLLFSEDASKEDLLERDIIINTLIDSIKSCKTDKVYTIGLTGSWGSGKSSILSIVKNKLLQEKNSIVVIDDFDPWMFGTQEAMLSAMYDEILSCTGVKFSFYSGKKIVRGLLETVTEQSKATGFLRNFFESEREYEIVKKMKRKIGKCLKQMGKTVVFTIDNLDRVDSKNILFLFKIIGSVLDLPNIVYVLAYDNERIKDVFSDSLNINSKYIEKIVQQEINVPGFNRNAIKRICEKCFDKLLSYYGVQDKTPYKFISRFIGENVTDLRQMKRLYNTAYIIPFCSKKDLYKPDLLAMEVIRFFDTSLYEKIRLNPQYFISKDISYSEVAYLIKDTTFYNANGAKFFENLLKDYSKYKQLLADIFPNVLRYLNNHELYDGEEKNKDESHNENALSISSGKYFDLYFVFGKNLFLDVYEDVNAFVDELNKSSDPEFTISSKFENVGIEWLSRFEVCLPNIEETKREPAALGILNILDSLNKDKVRYYGSIRQRATIIMVKLTKNSRIDFINTFVEKCAEGYNIGLVERIYQICIDLKQEENGYRLLLTASNDKFNELFRLIISNKIDIYEDDKYHKKGMWSLTHRTGILIDGHMRDYMLSIINEKNVYRIIVDLIHEEYKGSMYCYSISNSRVNDLFGTVDPINNILKDAVPKDDKEKLILQIWEECNPAKLYRGNFRSHSSSERLNL